MRIARIARLLLRITLFLCPVEQMKDVNYYEHANTNVTLCLLYNETYKWNTYHGWKKSQKKNLVGGELTRLYANNYIVNNYAHNMLYARNYTLGVAPFLRDVQEGLTQAQLSLSQEAQSPDV